MRHISNISGSGHPGRVPPPCQGVLVVFLAVAVITGTLPVQAQDEGGKEATFVLNRHSDAVKSVAFSDDGLLLATGSEDKTIIIWDVQTGEAVTTIGNNFFPAKAIWFFSNNELFAASGPDIKLIDFQGKILRTYTGKTAHIWSLDYCRKIGRITGGSFGKTIRVWDVVSGKEALLLEGHEKSALPVCFNGSGDLILSGSLDQTLRLWETDSGKTIKKMEGHSGNIFCVAFHPGGRYAASASADKTIRLWDLETGKIVQSYLGHESGIMDIDFSPEGSHILSCSGDHTIVLWETVTGNKLFSFIDHKGTVNEVAFSPDGSFFASASDDKTARVWKLDKRHYVELLFRNDIENAIAGSVLFNDKSPGESKQDYKERQDKAKLFLEEIYSACYDKYLQQLATQKIEDLKP